MAEAAQSTVTLKHLAAALADQHEITKKQSEEILNGAVGLVTKHRNRGKFPGPLTLACHYDGAGRISSARCGIWAPGMPRRSPKNS